MAVSLQHKRYSTYGWQVKNTDGSYKNTLAQGEIGVLLGHKSLDGSIVEITEANHNAGLLLNAILEVRIGSINNGNNQYFFDGVKISTDYAVKTVAQLPSIGNENCLYIIIGTGKAYYWLDEEMRFQLLSNGIDSETAQQLKELVEKIELNFEAINKRIDDLDSKVTDIEDIVATLKRVTYIIGVGPQSNLPNTAKDGAIYITTDTFKEYIWYDMGWIEFGDVSAEQAKIADLEQAVADLTERIENGGGNTNLIQVQELIATAKQEAIDLAEKYTDDKISDVLNQTEIRLSEVRTELIETFVDKTNFNEKIDEISAKFNNYYNKEETDDQIAFAMNNLVIDEINGQNAGLNS